MQETAFERARWKRCIATAWAAAALEAYAAPVHSGASAASTETPSFVGTDAPGPRTATTATVVASKGFSAMKANRTAAALRAGAAAAELRCASISLRTQRPQHKQQLHLPLSPGSSGKRKAADSLLQRHPEKQESLHKGRLSGQVHQKHKHQPHQVHLQNKQQQNGQQTQPLRPSDTGAKAFNVIEPLRLHPSTPEHVAQRVRLLTASSRGPPGTPPATLPVDEGEWTKSLQLLEEAWETSAAPFEIYRQLEVEPDANAVQIRKAFVRLVAIHHPDKGGSPEFLRHVASSTTCTVQQLHAALAATLVTAIDAKIAQARPLLKQLFFLWQLSKALREVPCTGDIFQSALEATSTRAAERLPLEGLVRLCPVYSARIEQQSLLNRGLWHCKEGKSVGLMQNQVDADQRDRLRHESEEQQCAKKVQPECGTAWLASLRAQIALTERTVSDGFLFLQLLWSFGKKGAPRPEASASGGGSLFKNEGNSKRQLQGLLLSREAAVATPRAEAGGPPARQATPENEFESSRQTADGIVSAATQAEKTTSGEAHKLLLLLFSPKNSLEEELSRLLNPKTPRLQTTAARVTGAAAASEAAGPVAATDTPLDDEANERGSLSTAARAETDTAGALVSEHPAAARMAENTQAPAISWAMQQAAALAAAAENAAAAEAEVLEAATSEETAAAEAALTAPPGHIAELTEGALAIVLDKRSSALVLYAPQECEQNTSSSAAVFSAVTRAFKRLSLLHPAVVFAKVTSVGMRGVWRPRMRVRDASGCSLFLLFKPQKPRDVQKLGQEGAPLDTSEASGEAEASRVEGEETKAFFFSENATEEDVKLQILKLGFPPSLRISQQQLFKQILFEFPRLLVRCFANGAFSAESTEAISSAKSRLPSADATKAASQLPIIDIADPSWASLLNAQAPCQVLIGPKGSHASFSLVDAENTDEQASILLCFPSLYIFSAGSYPTARVPKTLRLMRALQGTATVHTLTSHTAPIIFTESRPVAFFFGGSEPAIVEDFAFAEAAASWGGSVTFCSSPRPSSLQSRAIDYIGIREKRLPQVLIVSDIDDPKKTTKYICPNISTKQAITECLNAFKEGRLKPYYKSAEPPKIQRGPVYGSGACGASQELVSSQFKAVVTSSPQEVLLLLYSPNCPHSATFMPIFEEVWVQLVGEVLIRMTISSWLTVFFQDMSFSSSPSGLANSCVLYASAGLPVLTQLAIRVAHEESLLLARMDGTKNEVAGLNVAAQTPEKEGEEQYGVYMHPTPVSVHGYPVILFFAKKDPIQNAKVPIVYTGPRTAEALRNFVVSQTVLQAREDL
ncbi:thioredoxin domain-containing protein [Cyclospora cayetanensis]|uniref:Thioredoxin domain-containing protein n=1 Tax=Cyclospora cayetanensis TaxID=88456 RepID=A0A1D3CS18_9EIME|nr:thioredoxin domain-containing protein [Cyclospora cayetanensis]